MKRKFTIDASQKIQAAVDIDSRDNVLGTLIANMDQLAAYAGPKLADAFNSADAYLKQVIDEQVTDLYLFKKCLNNDCQWFFDNPLPNYSATEPTNIIPDMEYTADADGSYTWLSVYYKGDNIQGNIQGEILDNLESEMQLYKQFKHEEDTEYYYEDDLGQYYLGDDSWDPKDFIPSIVAPNAYAFIMNLIVSITAESIYNPVDADIALSWVKQLIDGYCDFVARYCNKRTNEALQFYLNEENN